MTSRALRLPLLLGLLGWFSVCLQFVLSMRAASAMGISPPVAVINYFSYFTVLSNILAAMALTFPSWFSASRAGRFFAAPMVRTVIAVSMAIVGLVYSLVLRAIWEPQGLQKLADHLLHDVMPPLYLLFWWFAVKRNEWTWGGILRGAWYPLGFLAWSLARGAVDGRYPYPFVDAGKIGYAATLANSVGVLALFAVVTSALYGLNRLKPAR